MGNLLLLRTLCNGDFAANRFVEPFAVHTILFGLSAVHRFQIGLAEFLQIFHIVLILMILN
jgi:hypothetical protein